VALIRGEEILKMWRSKIEFGVSEGNDYVAYAKSLSPISEATTEATKIAIKLINFQLVDISKVELPEKLTKEQKAAAFNLDIVRTTKIAEPVILSYLSSNEHSTTEDEQINSEQDESTDSGQWFDGSATKITAKTWRVMLSNREEFEVKEEDLLDSKRFFIKNAFRTGGRVQKQKEAQKAKRRRCKEMKENEKVMLGEAKRQRADRDYDEFTAMCSRIADAAPGHTYQYEEFKEMLVRLRAPFKTIIDGHAIAISESDAAIMMKESVFDVIKDKILVREKPTHGTQETTATSNKRRRTGGNATVNTVAGATGHTALYQSARRDARLTKEAQKKKGTKEY
jgi:hypothetical protein